MTLHTIQTDAARTYPWRNGGGVTRELLTWPPLSGDDWAVRVSVATIDKDGPFSAFPGIQRWFAVLDGAGVQLLWRQYSLDRSALRERDGCAAHQGAGEPRSDCVILRPGEILCYEQAIQKE